MAFLRWQCRLRQIAVRQHDGRPSDGMMPAVFAHDDSDVSSGHIITVLNKLPEFSRTMELQHLVRYTHDPKERRAAGVEFLSERYYQRAYEFSDTVTCTFAPDSEGARQLLAMKSCRLHFEQFGQIYETVCTVWRISVNNPLYQATYWHNSLFNPALAADSMILGFEPHWERSEAQPSPV
ncbi:MAG: hypothetical protein GKR94_32655 [Gammaproteobacteria bacterium]|nr:hypothetical protein [Gammaproteobacteria bacterium]